MTKYPDTLIVKDALNIYFDEYHFKDGGYNLKWFKIKLGPIFIPLPNIKSRVNAVKIHDIHHLLTEYNADWKGEVEIGAWEIATGCGKYWAAWLLNLGSLFIGMFLFPRALYKAFMRGRKCKSSLYYNSNYPELLSKTIGELREKIEIDLPEKNSFADNLLFQTWCLIALCYHILVILILLLCINKFCKLFS
ncbi:MAG: hypothetical protein NTV09_10910 [Bacteroidetes bacterium]|nr:hypothetical protein [Bacteroidota bacterium]